MLTTVSIKSMYAQYYSVNIDTKTVAAMVGAYATETAAEALYNEQVKTILKHYSAAEVAAAGIFASKYLDRKALTDLGIWANSTENYYYRRIYNLVSTKIMPKIWTVAKMMLKNPHNALYWGTYLMKVCDDTKTLCMQFESIVTNSTLSFSDIAFLQINQEVAEILKLSELGGVDFKSLLDNFSEIGKVPTYPPSRITVTRSVMTLISSIRWEIYTIPNCFSRRSRMILNNSSISASVSAAEGSSKIITFAS